MTVLYVLGEMQRSWGLVRVALKSSDTLDKGSNRKNRLKASGGAIQNTVHTPLGNMIIDNSVRSMKRRSKARW